MSVFGGGFLGAGRFSPPYGGTLTDYIATFELETLLIYILSCLKNQETNIQISSQTMLLFLWRFVVTVAEQCTDCDSVLGVPPEKASCCTMYMNV
jgi:hypothetical protein